jgi:hypothetical protein
MRRVTIAITLAVLPLFGLGDAAAGKGHEGIGAVRGVVVAGAVLPHAELLVLLLVSRTT